MENGEGSEVYKHVILAKMKDDIPEEKLVEMLKKFAILPALIPGMKTFHWGKDESTQIKHKGYDYVFEATFDSLHDIKNYYDHPGHSAFAKQVTSVVEDYIVVNYKPLTVKLGLDD